MGTPQAQPGVAAARPRGEHGAGTGVPRGCPEVMGSECQSHKE